MSPVPLGRQPERADSKNPADHFLVMPADIARSNETSCLAGQAGRLPYLLLLTEDRESIGRVGHKSSRSVTPSRVIPARMSASVALPKLMRISWFGLRRVGSSA